MSFRTARNILATERSYAMSRQHDTSGVGAGTRESVLLPAAAVFRDSAAPKVDTSRLEGTELDWGGVDWSQEEQKARDKCTSAMAGRARPAAPLSRQQLRASLQAASWQRRKTLRGAGVLLPAELATAKRRREGVVGSGGLDDLEPPSPTVLTNISSKILHDSHAARNSNFEEGVEGSSRCIGRWRDAHMALALEESQAAAVAVDAENGEDCAVSDHNSPSPQSPLFASDLRVRPITSSDCIVDEPGASPSAHAKAGTDQEVTPCDVNSSNDGCSAVSLVNGIQLAEHVLSRHAQHDARLGGKSPLEEIQAATIAVDEGNEGAIYADSKGDRATSENKPPPRQSLPSAIGLSGSPVKSRETTLSKSKRSSSPHAKVAAPLGVALREVVSPDMSISASCANTRSHLLHGATVPPTDHEADSGEGAEGLLKEQGLAADAVVNEFDGDEATSNDNKVPLPSHPPAMDVRASYVPRNETALNEPKISSAHAQVMVPMTLDLIPSDAGCSAGCSMKHIHLPQRVTLPLEEDRPDAGTELPDIVLGRCGAHVHLDSLSFPAMVSRKHCRLKRDDGGTWWLEDLGATNGTALNGASVRPWVPVRLSHGDQLCLGICKGNKSSEVRYKVSFAGDR